MNTLEHISGPVYWSVFNYQGRHFHFFGDKHGSCDNDYIATGNPCSRITPNGLKYETDQAKDIAYLLYDLFERNKQHIDFFLEIPYSRKSDFPKEQPILSRTLHSKGNRHEDIQTLLEHSGGLYTEQIHKLQTLSNLESLLDYIRERMQKDVINQDYIQRIYYTFANCFNSIPELPPNPYHPYVRFHRANIQCVTGQDPRRQPSSLLTFLYSKMNDLVKVLRTNPKGERKVYFLRVLENFHTLVTNCTQETENEQSGKDSGPLRKLFSLHFHSDDFRNDVIKVLSSVGLTKKELAEFTANMTTNVSGKDGKIRHKIKVQLDALRSEGSSDVADLIERFCCDKYQEGILLLKMWENIYDFYITPWKMQDEIDEIPEVPQGYVPSVNEIFLMDAYVLARMFRKFHGNQSDIVITYTGVLHSMRYHEFLSKHLNAECLEEVGGEFLSNFFEEIEKDNTEKNKINRYITSPNFGRYF